MPLTIFTRGMCYEFGGGMYEVDTIKRWLASLPGGMLGDEEHPLYAGYTFAIDVNQLGAKQATRQFVHNALRSSPLGAHVMDLLYSTSLCWYYFRAGSDHETVYFDELVTEEQWIVLKELRRGRFRALVRLAKRHCLPRDIVKRIFALL